MIADGPGSCMYRHVPFAIEVAREVFRADLAREPFRVVVVFGMMARTVAA